MRNSCNVSFACSQELGSIVAAHLLAVTGALVRLAPRAAAALRRVQRVTLLNEAHTVSVCLLAERGLARYPEYSVARTRSAFASRAVLDAYEAALTVRYDGGPGLLPAAPRVCAPPSPSLPSTLLSYHLACRLIALQFGSSWTLRSSSMSASHLGAA